jgi:hypothetical protein
MGELGAAQDKPRTGSRATAIRSSRGECRIRFCTQLELEVLIVRTLPTGHGRNRRNGPRTDRPTSSRGETDFAPGVGRYSHGTPTLRRRMLSQTATMSA